MRGRVHSSTHNIWSISCRPSPATYILHGFSASLLVICTLASFKSATILSLEISQDIPLISNSPHSVFPTLKLFCLPYFCSSLRFQVKTTFSVKNSLIPYTRSVGLWIYQRMWPLKHLSWFVITHSLHVFFFFSSNACFTLKGLSYPLYCRSF